MDSDDEEYDSEDDRVIGGVIDQELPMGNDMEGHVVYRFGLCWLLKQDTTQWTAITNASSHMLFATACYLKDNSWSDGACRPS